MAKLMQLEILTPDKSLLLKDNVSYLLAETVVGGVGVFANHAPLIATLVEAPFKYQDEKGVNHFLCLDGGFMEVNNNKVTILSVSAEAAENINVARAELARERAETKLANPEPITNIPEVQRNLRRAKARLKTVELAKQR
ncbi:MAG: ATP synthase F1 subunit epsilon [Acidaminococcaceae bacterium]